MAGELTLNRLGNCAPPLIPGVQEPAKPGVVAMVRIKQLLPSVVIETGLYGELFAAKLAEDHPADRNTKTDANTALAASFL